MNTITDLLNSKNEFYDNQKVPGVVQGIVVENNNAEFKGMVKVEFTAWENGKNMCEWVRLMSPYTGNEYGAYVVPEIDEIVLVGFIGGSLKRPFLLGSLYPSGAGIVNEGFQEKNYIKQVKTKGGLSIQINDEKGKQSICVKTPKQSTILIEDENETCTISDKDKKNRVSLDYKNGRIEVNSDKNITLKTGSVEISLDGKSGKLTVKADSIEIKGKQSIKAEAASSLELKGATAALQANGKLTVKSSAMTEIGGAMVKIN